MWNVEGAGAMKELEVLKLENDRLLRLAQRDSLTGLLNRMAIEVQVNKSLEAKIPGVFLMIDVDEFKYINDKYGHPTGDRVLTGLSKIMELVFFKKDIIGRIGGDEFAVFLPGNYKKSMVENKVNSLKNRFAQAGKELGIESQISITVGAEFSQCTDRFQTLYERADIAMRVGKTNWKKSLYFYEASMKAVENMRKERALYPTSSNDIKCISHLLRENALPKGAYYQEFNTFISIYRFLERGLKRTGLSIQMILLTLTDQSCVFVSLEEREFLMERLRESLCTSLRSSDIYSQYSSCQLVAMLPGSTPKNMDIITNRIQNAFRVRVPNREDLILSFSYYPLQPSSAGNAADACASKIQARSEEKQEIQHGRETAKADSAI